MLGVIALSPFVTVGFPVCTNIDQLSSIHDLHGDNISAATANRDIEGLS